MSEFNPEAFCTPRTNAFRKGVLKRLNREPPPFDLELKCFQAAPFGSEYKWQFSLNLCRMRWPEQIVCIEKDGVLNDWFVRTHKACCRYKKLNLMGCASSGKSYAVGTYVYNMWTCSPFNTSVYVSSTTLESLNARIWRYIKNLHDTDKFKMGVRLDYRNTIVFQEDPKDKTRDYGDAIIGVAMKEGSDGNKALAAISGRKNVNVLWCAQPLTSKVLTPNGWVENKELKEGSEIIGNDGKTHLVSKVHPVSEEPVYRLRFTDGSFADSTMDHRWTFIHKTSRYCSKQYKEKGFGYVGTNASKTSPLSYFCQNIFKNKNGSNFPRWSLPEPSGCEFTRKDPLPISPYLLGALLGDGCIRSVAIGFYNCEEDIIEHVRSELPEGHELIEVRKEKLQFHLRGVYGKGKRRHNHVIRSLKDLGLWGRGSSDKFVPSPYLLSSREDRIALLQGLMDTDGCVLNSTNRFTSISDKLRSDVIHLVRSLGGYARESLPYTVVFNLDGIPCFRSARKLSRARKSKFKPRRRALVSVEYIGEAEVRCITTTAPDGLYITDNFVATHNCDEMAHMNVDILEGRLNLFANPFSQFIGMSNKPNEGDPMYIDAEPFGPEFPDGWKSVTTDMEGWPTKGGYCIYFDGEKSPNRGCPPGKPKFRGLITDEMIDQIREASGGDDSPGYWTQVRGFPQPGDIQDTVLTGKLIQSKQADQGVLWGPEEPVCVAGLDLGFRADGDPCVADFAKLGKDVDGITVLCHEPDTVQLVPKMQSKEPFEVQIADRFLAEAKPRSCRDVMVDVSGDGGIIAQALVRRSQETGQKLTVHLCSFLGAPDPDASYMSGGKRRPAKELFDRRVSELWYSYRISVTNGVIKGLKSGSKAVKELCQRKVMQDEKKRWVVEPKKEMKKRIRRSPDNGDARILSHAMACKKGLSGSGKAQPFNLRQEPVNPLAKKPPVYGGNPSKRALYSR